MLITSKTALIAVALLTVTAWAQLDFGQAPKQMVSAIPFPAVSVAPGAEAKIGLQFRVDKGIHINSNKPSSELLIPTALRLDPPQGIAIEKIIYPPGKDVSFQFAPEEKLNVYEGNFTIVTFLKVPRGLKPGAYKVLGELKYQACNDSVCFPPKKMPVEFEVTVRPAARAAR